MRSNSRLPVQKDKPFRKSNNKESILITEIHESDRTLNSTDEGFERLQPANDSMMRELCTFELYVT